MHGDWKEPEFYNTICPRSFAQFSKFQLDISLSHEEILILLEGI